MEHLRFDELKNGEEITVEKLAVMIGKGFEHIDTRLDGVDARLDGLDTRLGRVESEVHKLRDEIVHRQEFDDALARIKYIERKLGIENGV